MKLLQILTSSMLELVNKITSVKLGNISSQIWLIPFIASLILVSIFIYIYINQKIKKRRYLRNKERITLLNKIINTILTNKYLKRVIETIALKICILNDQSLKKNKEYSALIFIGLLAFMAVNLLVLIPSRSVVWYNFLFLMILILLFLVLVLYIVNTLIRFRFTKQLPKTYKLLNSRLSRQGDILKAIEMSIHDLDKAVSRELTRLLDVLAKNDEDRINDEFETIDKIYNNEYFTILLSLIKHSYYKPGNRGVQRIFAITTSNILLEIQMQKKLYFANIWYILIALLIPYGIKKVEEFNLSTLG